MVKWVTSKGRTSREANRDWRVWVWESGRRWPHLSSFGTDSTSKAMC